MLPARLALPLSIPLLTTALLAGQSFVRTAAEENVNQQYLIESVSFAGVDIGDTTDSSRTFKIPDSLHFQLSALVGQRCDVALLEDLSDQIRRQLHLKAVNERLSRGTSTDLVRVDFQVERKEVGFDVSLPKFLYHSEQGFTGEVDANATFHQNTFTFGLVSNGDDLTERFSGLAARYESAGVDSDKVHFITVFETYHETWNSATVDAVEGSGLDLYRSRRNVAPEVTYEAAPGLTIAAGASFEETQSENPAVGDRSSNAATFEVHYGHRIEKGGIQQHWEGKYNLRVATRALGSSYAYARHLISMRYEAKSGRHVVSNEFTGGSIAGDAPFFERFVLGTSSTLRGWNRYEIDPLGGNRVVHDEMAYGYRVGRGTVDAFWDTGVLWNSDTGSTGRAEQVRHSVGLGYKQGVFTMALAFPVFEGRIEPIFMAGMNY